jgi:hypothetical protein
MEFARFVMNALLQEAQNALETQCRYVKTNPEMAV